MKKNLLKILILSLFFFGAFGVSKAEAGLSCYTDTDKRNSGDVAILGLSASGNAHAALPGASTYANSIYCGGVSGIGNSCSGNFKTFAKLSSATNAHVRSASEADYPGSNNTCLSNSNSKATIAVDYKDDNCSGFDTAIASLAKFPTNAHIGDANAYPKKICASMSVPRTSSGGKIGGGGGFFSSVIETITTAVISAINNVTEVVQETGKKGIAAAGKIEKTLASKETYSSPTLLAGIPTLSDVGTSLPLKEIQTSNQLAVSAEDLLASPLSSKTKFPQNVLALISAVLALFALIFVGRKIFVQPLS
ncbi:hypothetical protein A3A09_02815 [Candidatus Nomurabacteria bacterium RIFCSPLOWO2_01_FULL_42_20]|uniref:Uncharacterized protein n=1 Tax=Candidatus Nomurabacteria bacterium RIFCSPHIGHO2_01_FULL_42_16 TaxID=1801743 RepID=A0A1F6VHC1_9BACT|nr:MAG: hypothetical protein A2824_02475 [Candidatus Nomurabacteria bacterium RIFCSPHIGHO2_01_FULL_42_16]OGI91185.1 MAG: hypothetical protein A3A09_02815 [Candidatus Nomurabacteria bacterium RIFCSPLOWO2_01_FULL_42_20]